VNRLETIIRSNPDLMRLPRYLRGAALPRWRLFSGCLYQTVWNVLTNRPRGTGIQDYDVTYFDGSDLSWKAKDAVIRRMGGHGPLQIRNQARVQLWYERHFGVPYTPLRSPDETLLRYPVTVQAVAARLEDDERLDIAAPFGLNDVLAMMVRPNPIRCHRSTFDPKATRVRAIWPKITVIEQAEA
jgi:hypothetical protein